MRIGILIDGWALDFLTKSIVEKCLHEGFTVFFLISESNPSKSFRNRLLARGVGANFGRVIHKLIQIVEQTFVRKFIPKEQLGSGGEVLDFDLPRVILEGKLSKSGFVFRYSSESIAEVRRLKFDVLIRCGGSILKGGILDSSTYGVFSFHHGDNRKYRGGPPGLWEIIEKQPTSGFIIQRLTNTLDGGIVLWRSSIPTFPCYTINQNRLYRVSLDCLMRVLCGLNTSTVIQTIEKPIPYDGPLYKVPTLKHWLIYLMRLVSAFASRLTRKLTGAKWSWQIAYQFVDKWRDTELFRSIEIDNPKNSFLADPFIALYNDEHYIFSERYSYKEKKGSIYAHKLTRDSGVEDLGDVLVEPFHLSYPFITSDGIQTYMIPETHEKEMVRIYESCEFPTKWKLRREINLRRRAVDVSVFYTNGLWWLFANLEIGRTNEFNSELHAFYTTDLLKGEVQAHKQNPLVCGAEAARNGGLILEDDHVIRIAQSPGYDVYGESLSFFEIMVLTEYEYKERLLGCCEPNFSSSVKGVHTFSHLSGLTVSDRTSIVRV